MLAAGVERIPLAVPAVALPISASEVLRTNAHVCSNSSMPGSYAAARCRHLQQSALVLPVAPTGSAHLQCEGEASSGNTTSGGLAAPSEHSISGAATQLSCFRTAACDVMHRSIRKCELNAASLEGGHAGHFAKGILPRSLHHAVVAWSARCRCLSHHTGTARQGLQQHMPPGMLSTS